VTEAHPRSATTADPWLGRILASVVVLTFVSLLLWVVLALAISRPSPEEAGLVEGVSRTFTACLGAILGLLGGKVA
jgi:hypothetical protein